MKQADLGLNLTIKRTRKREFLAEMERVVPWATTRIVGAVSRVPNGVGCADSVLSLADGALYRAKANGRNRVEPATP